MAKGYRCEICTKLETLWHWQWINKYYFSEIPWICRADKELHFMGHRWMRIKIVCKRSMHLRDTVWTFENFSVCQSLKVDFGVTSRYVLENINFCQNWYHGKSEKHRFCLDFHNEHDLLIHLIGQIRETHKSVTLFWRWFNDQSDFPFRRGNDGFFISDFRLLFNCRRWCLFCGRFFSFNVNDNFLYVVVFGDRSIIFRRFLNYVVFHIFGLRIIKWRFGYC